MAELDILILLKCVLSVDVGEDLETGSHWGVVLNETGLGLVCELVIVELLVGDEVCRVMASVQLLKTSMLVAEKTDTPVFAASLKTNEVIAAVLAFVEISICGDGGYSQLVLAVRVGTTGLVSAPRRF